jgi:sugar transferase (PEP-CTERM/EpsH1 system associated)
MRIFFVSQRVPFPPDRGDKITTFNEVRHLSRSGHEVHMFCPGEDEDDLKNIPGLLEYAKTATAFPVSPWAARLQALAALVTGKALSVAAYSSGRLHAAIKAKYRELKPDLFIVYSANVAQYADHFPTTPRIMQFAELDSRKFEQYAERARIPMKWIYRIERRRFSAYEQRIAHSFSHALVCTAAEKRDFEREIPGAPVTLVANGVDLEYFRPRGTAKTPGSIVFTGVMDYLPNVDAVTWFADEVLPLVQSKIPGASFVICGNRPSPAVQRLADRPGVTVTGRVPDVRPYLDSAEVFVAPMRMARGIQNKVLEALAMGLPCVSSVAAWQGTVVPEGEGLVATDEARDFADKVVALLSDAAYRNDMAKKARAAAESHYSWDVQMQALDRVIALVTAQPRKAA